MLELSIRHHPNPVGIHLQPPLSLATGNFKMKGTNLLDPFGNGLTIRFHSFNLSLSRWNLFFRFMIHIEKMKHEHLVNSHESEKHDVILMAIVAPHRGVFPASNQDFSASELPQSLGFFILKCLTVRDEDSLITPHLCLLKLKPLQIAELQKYATKTT